MSQFTASTAEMPACACCAANDTFKSTNILPYRRPGRPVTSATHLSGGQPSAAEREDIRRRNRLIALANTQAQMENALLETLREGVAAVEAWREADAAGAKAGPPKRPAQSAG